MKTAPVKNRSVLPVPEEAVDRYLESVFSSRFFAAAPKGEKRDWIQSHFPFWGKEARRMGDEILQRKKSEPAARHAEPKKWGNFWNSAGWFQKKELSSEGFDPLLWLGKACWNSADPTYQSRVALRIEAALAKSGAFPLLKGIWLLYFMTVYPAPPSQKSVIVKLWSRLQGEASRESRLGENPVERGLSLLLMGTLFLESPKASSWRDQGRRTLEDELVQRVGIDGVCRSGALSDQLGLLQLYLQALQIGRRADPFSKPVERRVERMLEFLMVNRSYPFLPAAQGAPLFSLAGNETRAIEKTLGVGAVLFSRGDFKAAGGAYSEEAFFLAGPEGHSIYERLTPPSGVSSIVFEEAGYAVLKGADEPFQERTLLFQPDGESLSFSLLEGERVLLNKGSVAWRPDFIEPDRRRSIKRREFKKEGAFSRRFMGKDFDYLEARRLRPRSLLSLKRKILFVKPDYWIIEDLFAGEESLAPEWAFTHPSQAKAYGNLNEGVHIVSPDGSRLWVVPLGTAPTGVEIKGEGEKRVQVRSAGSLPLSLTTLFYPERAGSPCRHDFKSLYFPSVKGGTAFETLTPTRTDTFLIAPPEGEITLRSIRFDGELLFVRRDYLGEVARVFAVCGRSCMWEGKLLFESQRAIPFLELSYAGEVLHVRGALSGPLSLYADGVEEVWLNGQKTYFTRHRGRLILHMGA